MLPSELWNVAVPTKEELKNLTEIPWSELADDLKSWFGNRGE
jgi:hypothetical protein